MEEILASIRRIISEEDAVDEQPPMELGASQPATPAPPSVGRDAEEADDLMVFEDEEPEDPATIDIAPAPPLAAMPESSPNAAWQTRAPAPAPFTTDEILSEPARVAAADAFSRLSGALRISDHPGQSLEGLVREMLRPMLKEWLDANLPSIVEARVEAELNRIARLSR